MNRRKLLATGLVFALAVQPGAAGAATTEQAVTPEISPPGDIPDNQVFITFKSPEGFLLKVPEGWARTDGGKTTIFADKYDRIAVTAGELTGPLDTNFAKQTLVPEIIKGRAVKIVKVSELKLKGGAALKIAYTENSEPNSVTNKQIRMESERYYFVHAGKLVALELSAPMGADNVDQWKLISSSFRWK
jgi:hypothetical protein